MQPIAETNYVNEDENLAAKLATVLFNDSNSDQEWEVWKAVLQKEPFKSNMDSILYNVLKFVVFLDVDIGDVWFKYVTSVRPKLEGANLVDKPTLDENENKLKTLIYYSKAGYDVISKIASCLGFKDYALRRFEESPNKEKTIYRLTANIVGKKMAESWSSEIQNKIDLISEQFIKNDLVELKTNLELLRSTSESELSFNSDLNGENLKARFEQNLQEGKLAFLDEFEQSLLNHNLSSEEFDISRVVSEAYDKKCKTTYQVISIAIDTITETKN